REVLKRDPSHAKARLGLADELRKAHQNADAAVEYEAYLSRKPDDPLAILGAGQNLLEKGDEAEALRLLERASTLAPKNPAVLYELAEVNSRRGDFAAALELLDRAFEQNPYEVAIRHRRGLVLVRLGRLDEAKREQAAASKLRAELAVLNRARERLLKDPHDRRSQLELSQWMFTHGQELEGARWAERLLKEKPGDAEASRLLADYNETRGNHGLANYYRLHASTDDGKGNHPSSRPSPNPATNPKANGPLQRSP
ncbi:tetratricopeptide repeat protein, partial [Singulisphaera rosea]